MKLRKGFQLIEICIAVGLLGGAVVVLMGLLQSTSGGAQTTQSLVTARLLLADLSELLLGETIEGLRQASADGSRHLDSMLKTRVDNLPVVARWNFETELEPLLGKFSCRLEEDCEGIVGLARLTVSVQVSARRTAKLVRLFRPSARVIPQAPAKSIGAKDGE